MRLSLVSELGRMKAQAAFSSDSLTQKQQRKQLQTPTQMINWLIMCYLAYVHQNRISITQLYSYTDLSLHGKKFTLQDIEQNLFQIDEELGRDKRRLRSEHTMAAAGRHPKQTYRGSGQPHNSGRGRGRSGRLLCHRTPGAVAAVVTDTNSAIVCYKCGQPGHIAPQCPTNTDTAAEPQQQPPRTAPPARPSQPSARGHVAFAQEGDTSSSTTNGSRNVLVCMACSIYMDPTVVAKAMSARRLLDYNVNPTLCRSHPVPIPTI